MTLATSQPSSSSSSSSSISMRSLVLITILIATILSLLPPTVHAQSFPPVPIGDNLPTNSPEARVRAAAAADDAPAELVTVKAGVRWMDANIGQFGSTLNITFILPDIFTSRWQIRFHFAVNGTVIKEYWGSWTLVQLPMNWYQLVPHEELRLDATSNIYFSFNGNWDPSIATVTPETLGIDAAEIQIAPREGSDSPTVTKLRPVMEFMNSPFVDVNNVPFGNFIRSQKESKAPGVQPGGFKAPPPGPTSNWLGFYICQPLLGCAIIFFAAATINRWRYRHHFRKQCQERAWAKKSLNKSGSGYSASDVTLHTPANVEGGTLETEGGAVAEVYTYYTREQQRQSILQPGLAYRMSVYQAVNENEALRAGLKSPPLPELPKFGMWQGATQGRAATPTLRTGTPRLPPPAMPQARAPSPAPYPTEHYNEGYDMGISGRMNYPDGRQ